MSDLNLKFEEAKKRHELKEEEKNKMLNSILLTDEVVLRSYAVDDSSKKVLFFQKNVDLSKIAENYNIIHEEDNPKFFDVSSAHRDAGGNVVTITSMYILVPKKVNEKTLCLFITRETPTAVSLEIRGRNYTKEMQCFTNFYCEKEVYASISEYKFWHDPVCSLQITWPRKNVYLHLGSYNYKEVIKQHIENNFLNQVFDFKVVASEDYQKYLSNKGESRCSGVEELIVSALKESYEDLDCAPNKFKTLVKVKGYNVELKINRKIETVDAEILGEKGVVIGFVKAQTEVMKIDLKMYYKGKIFDERKINLLEDKEFQDNLTSYFNEDYILNC